jgi:putative methylase
MIKFRKKDLEIILQKLPPHPAPMVKLEQYPTPAIIAADILYNAYLEGDIADKIVLDLGCGTGIFAIGAKLLGADKVMGIDIDGTGLAIGKGYSEALSLDIDFIEGDINSLDNSIYSDIRINTVIQNPPFGAQKSSRGADRTFLEKAIALSEVVYSIHLSKTQKFIELLVDRLGGEITMKKEYIFPINHMFFFHSKENVNYEVILFRIKSIF